MSDKPFWFDEERLALQEFEMSEQSKPKESIFANLTQQQLDDLLSDGATSATRKIDALSARCAELEKEIRQMQADDGCFPYCPSCNSCGEDGCCPVEMCKYPGIKAETVTQLKEDAERDYREIESLKAQLSEKERELAEVKLKLENIAIEKLNDNRDMKIRVLESQNADLQRCCDLHDVRVAERNEAREMLAEKERELDEVREQNKRLHEDFGKSCPSCGDERTSVKTDQNYTFSECSKCNQTWMSGKQMSEGDFKTIKALEAKVAELEKQLGDKDAEIEKWKSTFGACPACGEEFVTLATTPFFNLTLEAENQLLRTDWVKMKAALDEYSELCVVLQAPSEHPGFNDLKEVWLARETLADLKYKGE